MHKAHTVEKDTLEFMNAQLTPEDLKEITTYIEKNHKLEYLRFVGCNLTAADFALISPAIMNSKNLEYLGLHNNDVCSTANGVQNLIQILQINPSIERLILSQNNLTTAIITELVPAILNNRTIKRVCFGCNQLGEEAFALLQPLITTGKSLLSTSSLQQNGLSMESETKYRQLINGNTSNQYNINQDHTYKKRCVLF